MAYTKQTWADLPSKTTPINATRLGHIEDGIYNAAQTADTAASTAGTAAANVGIVSGRVETLTGRVNGLDTAVSNKVDKVTGKGLSTNDYDDTDKGKVDSLGTASTKNSTSVVTESSDLVESGAVKDIVGWGNKNLLDPDVIKNTPLQYVPVYVGDGEFTLSSTCPQTGGALACIFLLAGSVRTGASTSDNGVWNGQTRTVTAVDGYVTVASRNEDGVKPTLYHNQLEVGSTATAYEPYHASVEDTLRDAEVIEGKNLLNNTAVTPSSPVNGVTITINADKSVTLNNSATANMNFQLYRGKFKAGKYIARKNKLNSQSNRAWLTIYSYAKSANLVSVMDNKTEEEFTVDNNDANEILIGIYIYNGASFSNETIYPMITQTDILDSTYEPYYTPLKDVVPTKADNSVIGTVEDGATVQKSGGYAVGSHAIRNGAFITWKKAKAQGETINDVNDYTSGDVADNLVYKAGDSVTNEFLCFGWITSGSKELIIAIPFSKKIIASNASFNITSITVRGNSGYIIPFNSSMADYNIATPRKMNDGAVCFISVTKKDGTAFNETNNTCITADIQATITFS